MRSGSCFAIGAIAFAVLQILWGIGHAHAGRSAAWIMKNGSGIAFAFVVFFALAMGVVAHRHRAGDLWKRARFLWLGALAAMAVALLVVGPGNLWPIVMVFDGAIVAAAIAAGGAVGAAIGRRQEARET